MEDDGHCCLTTWVHLVLCDPLRERNGRHTSLIPFGKPLLKLCVLRHRKMPRRHPLARILELLLQRHHRPSTSLELNRCTLMCRWASQDLTQSPDSRREGDDVK